MLGVRGSDDPALCWLWRLQGLRALVYPLAQVLLGAARLVPAPRYFPLRLRLVGTARLHEARPRCSLARASFWECQEPP